MGRDDGICNICLSPGDRYHCSGVSVVNEERMGGKFNRTEKISDESIPLCCLSSLEPHSRRSRRCSRRSYGVLSCTHRRIATHSRPRNCQQGGHCDIRSADVRGSPRQKRTRFTGSRARASVVLATAKTRTTTTVP